VLQLVVPVLATAGGVALLGEAVDARLVGAGAIILLGVGLAIRGRS
jgi:drug/metabolite transporter (DMT)-like permease